uniref:protein SIX6OS1-like isoform X4 n=1 Tax=Pristiophorus japonicus TaxID=55135 RepID=UPI00398E4440
MENTNKLTHLDKILLKLVFQVDQGSQQQKEVKQQIHIYSANIIKKRQDIDELHGKSSQLDDEINRMQKISAHITENFKVWKPTCLLLAQHEEHFEKKLLEQHASTIGDNIYQQHEYHITLNTVSTEQAQSQRHATVGQKSTLSLKPFKLAWQQSQTETESGKHKNLQANNVLVTQLNSIQKECEETEDNIQAPVMEFCVTSVQNHEKSLSKIAAAAPQDTQASIRIPELSGLQQQKNFQMALATKNQGQTQYCPFVPKDQKDTVQWFENNPTMSVKSDDATVRKLVASQSKPCVVTDSLYKSQAQIGLKSMSGDPKETTDDTPQMFPRTPEQVEAGQKEFEMNSNLSLEETPSKSPGFCFLNTSTPKSTEFNLFGRTAFDTPEQVTDNQMSDNQFEFSTLFFKKTPEKGYSTNITNNHQSSQKDIGIESPSTEQPFTFSFQSDLPPNNFGNSKDEFSFGFSFGQDQRSSQPGLFKLF